MVEKSLNMGLNLWDNGENVNPADLSYNFREIEQEFVHRGLNIFWENADPAGIRDSAAAISLILAEETDGIIIPKGVYLLKSSLTVPDTKKLIFQRGARLKPASGKTLTVNGAVQAQPDDWIFDLSAGGSIAGDMKADALFPHWFGSVDPSSLQRALNAFAASKVAVSIIKDKNVVNTLTLSSQTTLFSNSRSKITITNSNVPGDLRVNGSDIEVNNVEVQGSSPQSIYFSGSPKRIRLARIKINTTGHGMQISTPSTEDICLSESTITAEKYGILLNSGAKQGKYLRIVNNSIYSRTSDAIELNASGTLSGSEYEGFRQVFITGNRLSADEYGTSGQAGFAIGIANTREVIVMGNISEKSRLEALHIEGDQQNLMVIGNIFNGCTGDGCRIKNSSAAQSPTITNNSFVKKNLTRTGSGIHRLYDPLGSLECNLASNYIRGFDRGIWIDGPSACHVEGTLIEGCNTGIYLGDTAKVIGSLLVKDCPTLVTAKNGAIVEKVVALTVPQSVMSYIGTSGKLGATLKNLVAFTSPVTTVAGSTNLLNLFALPSLLQIKLVCRINAGSSRLILSGDVTWDGTTLTMNNMIKRQSGSILLGYSGSAPLVNNNGSLALNMYTTSSLAAVTVNYDFTGMYYVEN
ncbi:right-handed parallel beta-helix repeat-containing protein [Paenibacillus nasutitermitis]|uniref:Right handed beta helix domain-containing protein n=1 Tax=Paenibacillus nasutitermitis TaxID=1652958 RepID=A0A917DWQ5_9BACL|nr:right-handed parallel beta-helix repeat-containing protein [Paenibacillus nasutitermitis]GGD76048.1 hypothetical protein GCM10010911_37590 [Paenibacillus nasutitermitis]